VFARRVEDPAVDRASALHLAWLPEVRPLTITAQSTRCETPVIHLARARDERRLVEMQRRTQQVVDVNKRALSRLFQSGAIYSRAGARLARDLLLAHQQLLKAGDLLSRLAGLEGPERFDVDPVFEEVQALLSRTRALSARSEGLIARR
jgi:hypothetical protein